MAIQVLSLQFDSFGCTNRKVRDLGGTSYDTNSCLGDSSLKCVYFSPYTDGGLEVRNPEVKSIITSHGAWSIYFKFRSTTKDGIILSCDEATILSVRDGSFIVTPNRYTTYFTRKVDFVFDDEWHTFTMTLSDERTLKIYIDGKMYREIYESDGFVFDDRFYIGRNLSGWYMDDFNVFDGEIYSDEFVPPTDYIHSFDTISNYAILSRSDTSRLEKETLDSIESNREHSASYINTYQKGWLPRRARFNWHYETHGYFQDHHWNRIVRTDHATYINVEGLDQPLLTGIEQYYRSNMEIALDTNKVLPMMIFVDKKFIRLSKIDIIKSDDYYCFKIYDRDRYVEGEVKEFDIVILPFPVIYEEDYGERGDRPPLYSFTLDGRFDPAHGHTYYYIKSENDPITQHIGIREHYVPTEELDADFINKNMMKFVWRYGTLEQRRLDDDGRGAYMVFQSEDYSWVRPGDRIILYNGVTMLDESLYTVMGYDLIYFPDIVKAGVRSGRTVTMQVITDSNNARREMLFQDFTDMKAITVEATVDKQSVFNIPEMNDGNGAEFRNFLLFKGHVLMDNEGQYTTDYENGLIKLNDSKDFVTIGRHLTFLFIRVNKADYRGSLYAKPILMYARPTDEHVVEFTPPDGIIPYKDNIIVFRNSTFVNPNRYTVDGNTVVFDEDDISLSGSSIVIAMLRIISPYDDPQSWRETMISREYSKGGRYVLYDLGISKKIKITLDNLICFDQDGRLINDLRGYVYNLNIIKHLYTSTPLERVVRYMTCVYRTYAPTNEANSLIPLNTSFMKEYIRGRQEYYEMDEHFHSLMEDFSFEHTTDKTYGENLSKSLDYIMQYNQNRMDDVYDKRATAYRTKYDATSLKNNLVQTSNGYRLSIPRDDYKQNVARTEKIYFVDGKLATDWKLSSTTNDHIITMPTTIDADSKIESIDFKNMSSFVYPLTSTLISDRKVDLDIYATIINGEEYNFNFSSKITITEDLNKYFPSSIEVSRGYDYIAAQNVLSEDLFDSSLTVSVLLNEYVDCLLEVSTDPIGIEVDLDSFNMTHEFLAEVEVTRI